MGVEDSIVCSVNIVSGIESAQVGLHLHMPCHDRVLFNCSLVSIFDKDGGNARLDIPPKKKKIRYPILLLSKKNRDVQFSLARPNSLGSVGSPL